MLLAINNSVYEDWENINFGHKDKINTTITVEFASGKSYTHHCDDGWRMSHEDDKLIIRSKNYTGDEEWEFITQDYHSGDQ